MYRKDEHVNRQ